MKKSLPLSGRIQSGQIDILQEVLREAEVHLASQLQAALAADLRAYTFSGLTMGANVLLVAAIYSVATTAPVSVFLLWVITSLVAALFVSAWLATQSARSVDFEFAGGQPGTWAEDIENNVPLQTSLSQQCEHYDGMIEANRTTMANNSRMFNIAVNIALVSSGIAGLFFMFWLHVLRP